MTSSVVSSSSSTYSSDNDNNEPIEAAVLSRSRRSTAGKRMSSLVGKAREDDESFWNHSTWKEDAKDNDNDNDDEVVSSDGSYNVEEEEEENRMDVFDSDFNDSEDDDDGDEDQNQDGKGGIGEEEAEVIRQMRQENKRKKNSYVEPSKKKKVTSNKQTQHRVAAGRELLKRKKGNRKGSSRRKIGEGVDENAGLVLNVQPVFLENDGTRIPICPEIYRKRSMNATVSNETLIGESKTQASLSSGITLNPSKNPHPAPTSTSLTTPDNTPSPAPTSHTNSTLTPMPAPRQQPRRAASVSYTQKPIEKQKRPVRSVTQTSDKKNNQSSAINTAITNATTNTANASTNNTNTAKQKQRKKYTQEELLMEAARITEAENERWLLQRKRHQTLTRDMHNYQNRLKGLTSNWEKQKQLYQRSHSRRSCFNTLTFFDMDRVPKILRKRQVVEDYLYKLEDDRKCVITGKLGRYKDPKTGKRYHDLEAYKELKRRVKEGEPIQGVGGVKSNLQMNPKTTSSLRSGTKSKPSRSVSSSVPKFDQNTDSKTSALVSIIKPNAMVESDKKNEQDGRDSSIKAIVKLTTVKAKKAKMDNEANLTKSISANIKKSNANSADVNGKAKKPRVVTRNAVNKDDSKTSSAVRIPLDHNLTKTNSKRSTTVALSSANKKVKNGASTTIVSATINDTKAATTVKIDTTVQSKSLSVSTDNNPEDKGQKMNSQSTQGSHTTIPKVMQKTGTNFIGASSQTVVVEPKESSTTNDKKHVATNVQPLQSENPQSDKTMKKVITNNNFHKKKSSLVEANSNAQLNFDDRNPKLDGNEVAIKKIKNTTKTLINTACNQSEPSYLDSPFILKDNNKENHSARSHYVEAQMSPDTNISSAVAPKMKSEKIEERLQETLPNQISNNKDKGYDSKTSIDKNLKLIVAKKTKRSGVASNENENPDDPCKKLKAMHSTTSKVTPVPEVAPKRKPRKTDKQKSPQGQSSNHKKNLHIQDLRSSSHNLSMLSFKQGQNKELPSSQLDELMYQHQLQQLNHFSSLMHSQQMMFGGPGATPNPSFFHGHAQMSPLLLALHQSSMNQSPLLSSATKSPPIPPLSLGQSSLLSPPSQLLKQQQEAIRQKEELILAQQKMLQQGIQANPHQHLHQLSLHQPHLHPDSMIHQKVQAAHSNNQRHLFLENQMQQQRLLQLQQQQHQQAILQKHIQKQHDQHKEQHQHLLALRQTQQQRLQRMESSISKYTGTMDQFADACENDEKNGK